MEYTTPSPTPQYWNTTVYDNVTTSNFTDNNTTLNESSVLTFRPPMIKMSGQLSPEILIPFYSLIFLLAVVGNVLVIVSLIQNRQMRTVTNVFLLNLSISDLLLVTLCMPFSLVPVLLKNFIFGAFMCRCIRYLQVCTLDSS